GLEVEALGRGRRRPRRLLADEVDEAALGDVLVALVELHAVRVGARVRAGGLEARVLQDADERVDAIPAGRAVGGARRQGQAGGEKPGEREAFHGTTLGPMISSGTPGAKPAGRAGSPRSPARSTSLSAQRSLNAAIVS